MRRSRALAYLEMAEDYSAAVQGLACSEEEMRAPFNMLVAHGLELSFKAALCHSGCDEERLMMLGHNLAHCHDLARSRGLKGLALAQIASLVEALDGPHRDQRFRYPGFRDGFLEAKGGVVAEILRLHLRDVRAYLDEGRP